MITLLRNTQHNTSFKRISFYHMIVIFESSVCIMVVLLISNIHLSVIVRYISTSLGLQMVYSFSVLSTCFLYYIKLSWENSWGLNVRLVTRKVSSYCWAWWRQEKSCWKLALCGTDVQIVTAKTSNRGERPIEIPSSWFSAKFPSGKL